MAYKNLGTFLTKITKVAISKLDDSTSDEAMRIAENVSSWANAGTITSAQLNELAYLLPEIEVEVPEEEPVEDAPVEEPQAEEPSEEPSEEEPQAEEPSEEEPQAEEPSEEE